MLNATKTYRVTAPELNSSRIFIGRDMPAFRAQQYADAALKAHDGAFVQRKGRHITVWFPCKCEVTGLPAKGVAFTAYEL